MHRRSFQRLNPSQVTLDTGYGGGGLFVHLINIYGVFFIGQALCQVLGLVLGTGLRISHFLIFPLSSGERIGMTSGSHWRKDCTELRLQEADISLGRELRLGNSVVWLIQYLLY